MPGQQVAARPQAGQHPAHHLALGRHIKIDHHVAQKNHIKFAQRRQMAVEIHLAEAHAAFDVRRDHEGAVLRAHALEASLRDNAAEVRGISLQIRILTLNAAIEAARAGSAGAPFAVIVNDMRQLAMRTAETSDKISKETGLLNAAVETAFRENTEGSASGTSIARAQEVIRGVVMSFNAMTESLSDDIESMAREREEVRGDISTALVSLQFQDRVSQILSHVSRSMALMSERLADGSLREDDIEAWLAEMSQAYTTDEEFTNLTRAPRGETSRSKEITYF